MIFKKGIRMLGIAESFYKKGKKSILVGVVQRSDLIIDGFSISFPTVGGMDATDKVLEIYNSLSRKDINVIGISGVVISWFNVIDLVKVYEETCIPVISITYEESEGLRRYFQKYFPNDWEVRWKIHVKNGDRIKVKVKTGYEIFIRPLGINIDDAVAIINKFIVEGKHPEPIRVAQLIANKLSKTILPIINQKI